MYTYSGVNVAVLNDVCKLVYYYMKQNATCDCCQQYWNVNYLYILGLPTLGIGPLQPLAISEIDQVFFSAIHFIKMFLVTYMIIEYVYYNLTS